MAAKKKNFITMRMSDEEMQAVETVMNLLDMSRSQFIRRAIHKALQECPGELKKRFEKMRL